MRTPPYLLLRPSGYYFRFAVPLDLRQQVGKTEIRKSLGTHDRRQALVMGADLTAMVAHALKTLRSGMANLPYIDFDKLRQFEIESLEVGGAKLTGVKVDSNNPLDVAAFNQVLATLSASHAAEAAAQDATQTAPTPEPQATAGMGKNMLSQIFPIYLRLNRPVFPR